MVEYPSPIHEKGPDSFFCGHAFKDDHLIVPFGWDLTLCRPGCVMLRSLTHWKYHGMFMALFLATADHFVFELYDVCSAPLCRSGGAGHWTLVCIKNCHRTVIVGGRGGG